MRLPRDPRPSRFPPGNRQLEQIEFLRPRFRSVPALARSRRWPLRRLLKNAETENRGFLGMGKAALPDAFLIDRGGPRPFCPLASLRFSEVARYRLLSPPGSPLRAAGAGYVLPVHSHRASPATKMTRGFSIQPFSTVSQNAASYESTTVPSTSRSCSVNDRVSQSIRIRPKFRL